MQVYVKRVVLLTKHVYGKVQQNMFLSNVTVMTLCEYTYVINYNYPKL